MSLTEKKRSDRFTAPTGTLTVFFIALIALFLSLNPSSSIFGLVSYAWAGFGATFGPLVLLALYWRGMTAKGAIAGLATQREVFDLGFVVLVVGIANELNPIAGLIIVDSFVVVAGVVVNDVRASAAVNSVVALASVNVTVSTCAVNFVASIITVNGH
mgnify:CR=1 FL=1